MTTYQPNWAPLDVILMQQGLPTQVTEADEPPAFNQHAEMVAGLLEAKAQEEQRWRQFEQQQAAYRNQEHARLFQELHDDLPSGIEATMTQAHAVMLETRQQAAGARQTLTQHEAARPRVAADIPAWSRQRTDMIGELQAFDGIATDAEQAYQRAVSAVNAAMEHAKAKRRVAAQQTYERRNAEVGREIDAKQRELNTFIQQADAELKGMLAAVNRYL